MIEISKIQTYGWEAAIRGMRNSRQSWNKSDSETYFYGVDLADDDKKVQEFKSGTVFYIGPNDLELAGNLAELGGSHAKFRRMIGVSMDILAPRYWWTEFDTYKVGTVANSTSTMYSIVDKDFDITHFSIDSWSAAGFGIELVRVIDTLNELRLMYLEEKDPVQKKMYWRSIIQLLPQSYNQLRTVSLNYEVLSHMCNERLYHKLDEWRGFCLNILTKLPYAKELIFCDGISEEP